VVREIRWRCRNCGALKKRYGYRELSEIREFMGKFMNGMNLIYIFQVAGIGSIP
jgi:hypothetical protein